MSMFIAKKWSELVSQLCKNCGHKMIQHLGTTDPADNDDESCGHLNCECKHFVEPTAETDPE